MKDVSFIGIAQVAALLLSVGMLAVLSRILTPEDFGIVGLGLTFLTLFYTLQDLGIMPAIIQRDSRIDESIAVGLYLRLLLAIVLTLTFVALSPVIAFFFENSKIALVVIVMCTNMFVLTAGFSSQTLLTRSLRFSKLAIATIAQSCIMTAASIALALLGFSYWSLILGSICGSVAYVATLIHYESPHIRPKLDRQLAKELWDFGKHLLIAILMTFVLFGVDQMIIAKALGLAALGFYVVATRFGRVLGQQIADVVNKVLFPTMARIKDEMSRLKTGYVLSHRMIGIVAVPLCFGISALSPLFVEEILGKNWIPAVIPLSILSIQGLINAFITPATNVLISIGRPRYVSIPATMQATAMVVGAYPIALYHGLNGVCLYTTTLALVVLIYFTFVLRSLFKARVAEMVRPLLPSLASGLVMLAVLIFLVRALPTNLVVLAGLIAVGGAIYVSLLHILSGGRDVREFIGLIRKTASSEKADES
jgi:O-antigen/teichoic acid export membrane protein